MHKQPCHSLPAACGVSPSFRLLARGAAKQSGDRLDAICAYWAKRLAARRGNDARAHSIRKIAYCAVHAPGIRFNIWSMVFLRLSHIGQEGGGEAPRYFRSSSVQRVLRRARRQLG